MLNILPVRQVLTVLPERAPVRQETAIIPLPPIAVLEVYQSASKVY
jgi:hypothetical protein